jgi:branched-chain amino acid transport system ATP-binding protein
MPDAPLLEVRGLEAFYGDFQALRGVSLDIAAGEIVAVVGANGAGKSTMLKAIAGQLAAPREKIRLAGEGVGGERAHAMARRGVALVPEGRRLFSSLSVEENLMIGAQSGRKGAWTLARVLGLFPVLGERSRQPSHSLSGGQQQMVAIGRALMSNPRLLLCDEISLGLSPLVVRDIYAVLPAIAAEGVAIAIVEQDVARALAASRRVACLREGRVVLSGLSEAVTRAHIAAAYFGV